MKNLQLSISSVVVIITGVIYGVFPNKALPLFLDIKMESIDLSNIFKSIMGINLGLATYWIIGIFKPKHWFTPTLICTIYMGGVALGRIVSLIVDGVPSIPLLLGLPLEVFSTGWGIINLKKNNEPN